MTLLVSSCWFFVASSLIFLINFISRRLSRTRIGDTGQRDDEKSLKTWMQSESELPDDTHSDSTNLNSTLEDELSGFIFKFEHQISDHGFIGKEESGLPFEEETEPNSTTRIQNYRFSAEKDFSGFVVEPEVKTFVVKESFVHPESSCSDDKEVHGELGSSFLSDEDKKQEKSDDMTNTATDVINEKPVNTNDNSVNIGIPEASESDADAFVEIREKNGRSQAMNMGGPYSSKVINVVSLNQDDCLSNSEPSKKEYPIKNNAGSSFLSDEDKKQEKSDDVTNTATDVINEKPVNTNDNSVNIGIPEASESDADAFVEIREENGRSQAMNMGGPDSSKVINDVSLNQDDCLSNSEPSKKEYPIKNKAEPLCDILEEKGTRFSPEDLSSLNVESEFHEATDRNNITNILSSKDFKQATIDASEPNKIDIINKRFVKGDEGFMHSRQLEQESFHTTSVDEFRKKEEKVSLFQEELSGFNSDSESLISESDGYSVKDLIADSDGFLSERDFDGCQQESATLGDDSTSNSEFKLEQSDFLHDNSVESDISHDINSVGIYIDEHLPEVDSYSHGLQQMELPNGATEASKVQIFGGAESSSNAMHIDFSDSSDDEFYSVNHVHGFGKSVHAAMDMGDLPDEDVAGTHSFDYRSPNSYKNALGASTSPLSSPTNGLKQENVAFLGRNMNVESPESENDFTHKVSEEYENSEEAHLDDLNEDDFDELESLWEHEDLIEQLKMELKRVKASGLPTILEESETPKSVEDLKSWKIEDKLSREDPLDELQKFYKSYKERMRKLDILNYQKMYAVGFLQLKDPLQSVVAQKPIIPTLTSILSQNLWPIGGKSSSNESTKFIKELRCELELVYVAQTCLSWEFLCWQYEKARELAEYDSYMKNQYNHVAGDFQQFQVILQRFLENETFQGPRLPNYVKTRCVLRNLIQVPVIREDSMKDKMEDQRKGNFVVTNEVLENIMEETIRLFWEFVKADKDESPGILKALRATHVELQDPSYLQLMLEIRSDLQKKKKKLNDILRTGNCLVKKFKKPKEDRTNQNLFFSQVDLKLIARVLRMSRITADQLMWCHKKLNKIMIVDRQVYREPSFLVFPF